MTPARLRERITASGHVSLELRCPCGRTSMFLGSDRHATVAELARRHRRASPLCRHLAALEAMHPTEGDT